MVSQRGQNDKDDVCWPCFMPKKKDTSWGGVAAWYNAHLQQPAGTYHRDVLLPNLTRLLAIKPGTRVLDLACGNGFFSRELFHQGAKVVGVDIAPELIALAKKQSPKEIEYHVAPAHQLPFLSDGSFDVVLISLAIQNIDNVKEVLAEASRVLNKGGRLLMVMNHPAFRIPQASFWGFDDRNGKAIQYRRIDAYLSESKKAIQMHPGDDPSETTLSFHRPLQFYFKALNKNGFLVSRLEEWISHKKSTKGPKQQAEDTSRKEIPLFLCLEAIKQ